MDEREAEDQIRELEAMIAELMGVPPAAKTTPDDLLNMLALQLAKTRGRRSWMARFEQLAWRMSAPLWDFRLRRQIRIVSELAQNVGWRATMMTDALRHLDDLVFARTYGRFVEAPVKQVVRQLVERGALGTHELRVLVVNRCFRVDANGFVTVPKDWWLIPLGTLNFTLAVLCTVPYMILALLVPADIGLRLLALSVFGTPFAMSCWVLMRYFIDPYRLIPRAQKLMPKVQLCI